MITGIFLATVEYNLDPLQRGRIKVRVNGIDDMDKPVDDLNWAEIINIGGAGNDFGNINIPEVGSTVYVSFLNGDPNKPLVLGGYYQHSANDKNYVFNEESEKLRENIYEDVGEMWAVTTTPIIPTPHNINEYPIESQTLLNNQPTKRLSKTLKGHTILIDDMDGEESFEIIDRAGQLLKFRANVIKNHNALNKNRRGIKRADAKNTFSNDIFEDSGTEIDLLDIKGQGLKIKSKKHLEEINIKSISKDSTQEIQLNSGKDDFNITIKNKNSQSTIRINNGEVSIFSNGNINIISDKNIVMSGKQIITNETNEIDDEFFTGKD